MNDLLLPWWERGIPGLGASPKGIGLALAVVAIAWILVRTVPRAVERGTTQARLNAAMRYAIARMVEYLLIVLAIMLVLGNLGIDLGSITLLVSALGVGIGFGLQTTVSNFFSGLVLLFEQPIRVGDRISLGTLDTGPLVGGVNGYVTKIGLRATIVETLDGITIVVPNNELVTKPVVNWSLGDPRLRVRVRIGVTYDATPAQVREVLVRAAQSVKSVLAEPKPQVRLVETAESSLDYQILAWIDDARESGIVETAIREAAVDGLREAGITIPYPQRVVHMESTTN